MVKWDPVDTSFNRDVVREFLMAAALHQFERIRNFIEGVGIPPDATFGGKPTAICYVVLKPHQALVHYLISRGARANQMDAVGMTPVHYAVLGGCEYCVSYLISLGAQLNEADHCGNTPLALAQGKPKSRGCHELLERRGAGLVPGLPLKQRMH